MPPPSDVAARQEPQLTESFQALTSDAAFDTLQIPAESGKASVRIASDAKSCRNGLSSAALAAVNLPAKRAEALRWVTANPGRSARELERISGLRKINARLSELESQGVVEGGTLTTCGVTGRVATAWRPTGNAPRPLVRPLPAAQRVRQLEGEVQQLRGEVERLRAALATAQRGQLGLFGGVQ